MKNLTFGSTVSGIKRQFDPLNNFFFYKIFGEKGDEVQLLSFINAVLGKTGNNKYISVEIQENTSFMAEIMGGKSCILDVRAKLPDGSLVNIEVQISNKQNMDRRSLFYLSKVYTSKLKSGHDYIELPNVIAINIVDFDFPSTKNYHSSFHLREDTEHDIILTDALEIHFINMVKYKKQIKDKLQDPLCRWLAWFDRESPIELLQEVVKMDSTIQTADERMAHVAQSEEEMWAYTRYMMGQCDRTAEINYAREEGFEKGHAEAWEESKLLERHTIARNLLAKGSTPEFVHEITGLDLETILGLNS
ncbi:MAG: Rpn family recombination-promoting nuclease/putative transposase [Treponema sp.]|nr:Rpn family recombination-promoting nuclease/putative transposase [Treponema sp.]